MKEIPCFKTQSKKAISRYANYLSKVKFLRGQTVYNEGDAANFVYIVQKGEFEVIKRLPKGDKIYDGVNLHKINVNGPP